MSVVEKDNPIADGLETSNGDAAASLKVTRSTISAMNSGRSTKPVLYREPRTASPVEIRAYIASRSESLQKFVAPLEEALQKASRLRPRPVCGTRKAILKVSELVLGIIRRIAHKETGVYSMEPNVPLLLNALYAGSVEGSIVSGLVRRAQEVQDAAGVDQMDEGARGYGTVARALHEYDVNRELDELTMLLKWYVKRKTSLTGLEVSDSRALDGVSDPGPVTGDEDDAVFGFEVMHDHQVFATKGCFVSCGLRLVGHDGQPLWLRVSVRWNGQAVAVRPEWSSWTDPGSESSLEVLSEKAPFCSLVPIRPNAQRIIIDDIRAFVPYAALDLPVGRCDIELLVAVIDNEGREVLSTAKHESICIPSRDRSAARVPAPHSVGMWPHDVVSGDRISNLDITSGYKVVAGWERHTVSAHFDLALFMHAGESVLLECRFLDANGNAVELSSLGIPYVSAELNGSVEAVSSYRYRRVLHPRGAWTHYRGLCVDIPVEFLLLEPGAHNLTCEIVIVSSDDRVLCGDIGLVSVHVPGAFRAANGGDGREESSGRGRSSGGVDLHSLEIDPSWSFGGEEGVRIEAAFVPKNASRQIADLASGRVGELFSPYRVEVSIEREDGHLLLQAFSDALGMGFKPVTRVVCVEGSAGFSHHTVVANFKKDEILGWSLNTEGGRGQTKVQLVGRVRVLSLAGEELLSQSRGFFVKPASGKEPVIVEVGAAMPNIVDVSATQHPQSDKLACRVIMNLPRGRVYDHGLELTCALHAPGKKPQEALKQKLSHYLSAAWARQQIGLTQVVYDFECDVRDYDVDSTTLVAALLSPTQGPLQAVHQGARRASVLVNDGAESAEDTDEGHEDPLESGSPKPRRGLFSWFKS